jgi:hypothetical protein
MQRISEMIQHTHDGKAKELAIRLKYFERIIVINEELK